MDVLSRPAEEFGNDETLEHLWAAKAMEHSDIYFNVLCSVDTRWLRLTPHDDLIYTHFRQDFPDLNVSYIKEHEIKNNINKAKWRVFCEKFKNIVEDYSFGTLMRADTKGDYSEENTMLVPRVQFYAIEIARNREGLNNEVKKRYKCASKANMEAQKHKAEVTV
ncbi:protein PBDC1 [Pectinophora gossypiella]|uniref:Polysaccharide biosynthesis domain-containing protein n=1 Tax=Pectinophora gossypiella TaxID=13191 RepID=A0A1E1WCV4_PECGO|nr:protein PBDC1 [Pectinophora gossypiella]